MHRGERLHRCACSFEPLMFANMLSTEKHVLTHMWWILSFLSCTHYSFVTLKAPITTAADDKFWYIFPSFRQNKVWYFMKIICQQTILTKYHALFVIFEKVACFENCHLLQIIGGALWVMQGQWACWSDEKWNSKLSFSVIFSFSWSLELFLQHWSGICCMWKTCLIREVCI